MNIPAVIAIPLRIIFVLVLIIYVTTVICWSVLRGAVVWFWTSVTEK